MSPATLSKTVHSSSTDVLNQAKEVFHPENKVNIEFLEISRAVAVGFLIMGFIGFAVKLVHIPINNILVFSLFRG